MLESMETLAAIFALSATIWLALGLGLAQLFRKQPARAHGVLVAVQMGALITPIVYLAVQQANWGVLPSRQAVTTQAPEPYRAELPQSDIEQSPMASIPQDVPRLEPIVDRPTEERAADPVGRLPYIADQTGPIPFVPDGIAPQESESPTSTRFSLKGLILWMWFGATVLMLLRLGLDFLAGYRLANKSLPVGEATIVREIETLARQLGLNSAPLLVLSEGIPSPVLWAWSSPAHILIPAKTGANSAFRGVYLHELAHLARRDHLSAFLGEIVWCLFPWHPLAWLTRRCQEARAEEACDDWAIACGCHAADYAEELVHLAPSRAGVLAMAAVSKSSRLKMRVSRLLRGAFSSPRLGHRWVLGVGLAALLFTGLKSILQPRILRAGANGLETNEAATELPQGSPANPSETTEVFVVAEGKPVAGAKVWLYRESDTQLRSSWDGPQVSDQAGLVRFAVEKRKAFSAFGLDEEGRFGRVVLYRSNPSQPEPKLILKKGIGVDAVVVHLGKPVSGVKCRAVGVNVNGSTSQGDFFPDRFAQGEVLSDDQGRIRFPYVSKGYGVVCEFTDERFAYRRALLSSESANSISLMKAGSLEIEFEGVEGPLSSEHFQWHLKSKKQGSDHPMLNEGNMSSGQRGENHRFAKGNRISFIEPGKYTLNISSTAGSPYLFQLKQDLEIRSEQVTKIKVPTTKGVQVTGRIVDASTGKGIPNYKFCLYCSHESRTPRPVRPRENRKDLREWAEGTTNEDGHYEVYVRGQARYGFEYPRFQQAANIDQFRLSNYDPETRTFGVQADVPESGKFAFPDLRLVPLQKVAGRIVDKQGRPGSGTVEVFDPNCTSKRGDYKTECDLKDGSFEWIGVSPERLISLRVRQGKAVNVPAELTPEQWKNGIKMVLDESNGVSFVGQIQDQQGHPVPKARLHLLWHFQVKGEGGAVQGREMMETTETDEQGRFLMKGHWPKERYYLHIEKTGYVFPGFPAPAMNREHRFDDREWYSAVFDVPGGKMFHMDDMKMGQPGETVDYGVIRLVKNTNLVRGKIVGSDGQPVAGIQVIAATEGKGSLKTTSDAQGRFEIGQLLDGPGFLIAKGQGYRATYVPFRAGDSDVAIRVRKVSEPPPPGPIIPKTYLAAREKMVRHVLESIWKTRQASGWGGSMLESMAELDPARAKEWLEQAPPQEKARWQSALKPMTYDEAIRLALMNVDDGIAAAKKMKPARVAHLLIIGERLLKANKDISLRFAEEAVIQFRAMGPEQFSSKVPGLAGAGALVWRAGQKESGQKLIQEAIALLQQDPQNRDFLYCNGSIAGSLAPIDWPHARERLELCVDPYQYNLALGGCIHQIAKDDPQDAKAKLALFKEEKGSFSSIPVKCRLHVAKRVAETDLDPALKLLEDLRSGQAFTHCYAQGLTELAIQIHPKDPARAHKLIDQAFDFLDELERSSPTGGSFQTYATLGALIAHRAQTIGHSDTQALIARTLGYLGGPPDGGQPFQKGRWKQTAFALAFLDPVLAKLVLERHTSTEELAKGWSGTAEPSRRSRDRSESGFLLALIDPERTVAAFDLMSAKGWTTDSVSSAAIAEIFGSFAKKGDLEENIGNRTYLMWIR